MPHLYHYTTISGLLGILESKHLWATDIRYLNDTTELDLLFARFGNSIENINPSAPQYAASPAGSTVPGSQQKRLAPDEFARRMFAVIKANLTGVGVLGVTCFSEAADSLSQWRAYSATGQGVALRFDHALLENQAKLRGYHLVKCDYGEAKLQGEVDSLLFEIEKNRQSLFDTITVMANFLGVKALRLAAGFKHEAFQDEQEWRLISPPFGSLSDYFIRGLPVKDVKLRAGEFTAIPYLEFPICYGDVWSIDGAVVGPSRERGLALHAVKLALGPLFNNELFLNAAVTASKIPYRAKL